MDEKKSLSAFELYGLQDVTAEPAARPEVHAGDVCPHCGRGVLYYDGTLTLRCPNCGYGAGGCFT